VNHKKISTRLTRRQFLVLSLGTAAAATIPITIAGCTPAPTSTPTPGGPTPTATPGTEKFSQPKEIRSENGVLTTSLLVRSIPISSLPNPIPFPTATARPGGTTSDKIRMYGSPKTGVTNPDPDNDDDWDFAIPGPTWRVNAGDRIKLMLYNRLDPVDPLNECDPTFYPTPAPTAAGTPSPTPDPKQTATPTAYPDILPDCFHESNATNIHYHGLHVDQGAHADDVFITLYPKDQPNAPAGECNPVGDYSYDFQVPDDHPQGTFWYHPHKHGAVALQMANGLSGTFIVEDTLKDDPVFNGQLTDYVIVFQTIQQTLNFPGGGRGKVQVFTVNGIEANSQALPEITLKVGEVQRWRIVNATFQDETDFNLQFQATPQAEPEIYFMAMDGYFLPEDRWQKGASQAAWFYSAPGNRTDFLVKGIEEGTFILEGVPHPSPAGKRGQKQTPTPTAAAPTTTTFLKVKVVKEKMEPPMGIPEKLPDLKPAQQPITDAEIAGRKKTLTFSLIPGTASAGAPTAPPKYLIAVDDGPGTEFDPNVVNECMEVDTAEEWTLINNTTPGHPFHIHLNPFFVTDYVDADPANAENLKFNNPVGLWQDVIIVPAAYTDPTTNQVTPGKVVFRHRFPDLTGKFVLHCHILGHEDRGFMHIVEVHAKGEQCSAPTCGHGH
jgi:FtsP/CotA-like multicopper oxidase with cupredoxin domain